MIETSDVGMYHVALQDVRIAVRDVGTGTPPVVLLHGLGDGKEVWTDLATELVGRGRRAVAVDLRGHGASSWPGVGYAFDTMTADTTGLLEALAVAPCDLVGHSLGGRVALHVAGHRSDLVRRVVLAEAPPARLVPTPVEVPDRPAGPTAFDWGVVSPLRHEARAVDPGWWEWIATIDVPALWVAGEDSQVPHDLLAAAAHRMPNARLATVPGGHSMHRQCPGEFHAAVLPFLHD